MTNSRVTPPARFDEQQWLARWRRMQRRYVPCRRERLDVILGVIAGTVGTARLVVDLGCGPGEMTGRVLAMWSLAEAVGVDLDGRLLALAEAHVAAYAPRVRLVQADLREPGWVSQVGGPADAVISSTSLHWLSPGEMEKLYADVFGLLQPGGVFLNSDHVGSDIESVQARWERQRAAAGDGAAETWEEFWRAFNDALRMDGRAYADAVFGPWRGVERGLSMAWHAERLAAAGFERFDCYWRRFGDAVYGARRPRSG
jgi:SAM-dependent methyltransferase